MSSSMFLFERLTRRYVDEYRHLDSHRPMGQIRVLPRKRTEEGNGFDDLGRFVRLVEVSAKMAKTETSKTINRALKETFTHWGCSHDHDCCGCQLVTASVQKTSNRRWLVRESIGRNF
jgi:hypothetical protein